MMNMKNRTNGLIGVLQRPRKSKEIISELSELLRSNSIRGDSSAYSSNSSSSIVGGQVEDFKYNLNFSNDELSRMTGVNLLFGFYSGEKNIGSLSNNYYCVIDGHIKDKKSLNEQYGISQRYSDVNMLLKLYMVLKTSHPNNFVEAVREFGDIVLRNRISVVLQDRVDNKCIAFTNKYLFSFTNSNNFITFSSELPDTFEARYAKLESNLVYVYDMTNCYLEDRIRLKINRYRNNFMLKNPGVFFDGSLESAVSLFVCQDILHSKTIHVGCLNKSMTSESILKAISEKVEFEFEGYYPNFEMFIQDTYSRNIPIDTYVDCLNVDSVGRYFSDMYLYKDYVDIYTMGNAKYISIFKYMSLPEIIQLGHILNVPFDKVVSCKNPIHYGTLSVKQIENLKKVGDELNIFVCCGTCDTCKRNIDGFALAGISDPFEDRYVRKLKPSVSVEKAMDVNKNIGDILSELRIKILSTIQL